MVLHTYFLEYPTIENLFGNHDYKIEFMIVHVNFPRHKMMFRSLDELFVRLNVNKKFIFSRMTQKNFHK